MKDLPSLSNNCPYCDSVMVPRELVCANCRIAIRGDFPSQSLAHLPTEHQRFIEMFVLASGNLKEIASLAGVSYPTVRSRLDKVIQALRQEIQRQTSKSAKTGEAAPDVGAQAAEIIKRI